MGILHWNGIKCELNFVQLIFLSTLFTVTFTCLYSFDYTPKKVTQEVRISAELLL